MKQKNNEKEAFCPLCNCIRVVKKDKEIDNYIRYKCPVCNKVIILYNNRV